MEKVESGHRARAVGREVSIPDEGAAQHACSCAIRGGFHARRRTILGPNSISYPRRPGGAGAWLRFVLFDVLSLPLLWLRELPRGRSKAVLAKAMGIWDGLRGRRVTAARIRPGASRL